MYEFCTIMYSICRIYFLDWSLCLGVLISCCVVIAMCGGQWWFCDGMVGGEAGLRG
jgi:hypothetical protein